MTEKPSPNTSLRRLAAFAITTDVIAKAKPEAISLYRKIEIASLPAVVRNDMRIDNMGNDRYYIFLANKTKPRVVGAHGRAPLQDHLGE